MALPNVDNIEKLYDANDSETILKRALSDLNLKKKNWKTYLVMIVICIVPAAGVGISHETVLLSYEISSDLLNVFLSLFGAVFTGYAFFQALINDDMLTMLLNVKAKIRDKDGCKFQEINENLVNLMVQYVLAILMNLFVKTVLSFIPEDLTIFAHGWINNSLAGLVLSGYFFFTALILWLMISFLFNMFQLFNLHAATRALEIVKRDKNIGR